MINKKVSILFIVVLILGVIFWVYNNKSQEGVPPVSVTPEVKSPSVSTLSVKKDTSSASAINAGAKVVNWQTSLYPADTGVNINLLRKVSDTPEEFKLVRSLAKNTANDGQESWTPKSGETTDDLYIEVTCSTTHQFNEGCSLTSAPVKVAQ